MEQLVFKKKANKDEEDMFKRLQAKNPTHNVKTMQKNEIAMMSVINRENKRLNEIKKVKE